MVEVKVWILEACRSGALLDFLATVNAVNLLKSWLLK